MYDCYSDFTMIEGMYIIYIHRRTFSQKLKQGCLYLYIYIYYRREATPFSTQMDQVKFPKTGVDDHRLPENLKNGIASTLLGQTCFGGFASGTYFLEGNLWCKAPPSKKNSELCMSPHAVCILENLQNKHVPCEIFKVSPPIYHFLCFTSSSTLRLFTSVHIV